MNSSVSPAAAGAQSKYQVRFDTGVAGLRRLAGADIVVWVDALGASEPPTDLVADALVVRANLADRSAVAAWAHGRQIERGARTSIAVIAADAGEGFAAGDVLAAGAVIDALEALGIDFTSPEAAVASAAFQGLRGAVGHLLSATVAGQAHAAAHGKDAVKALSRLDSVAEVRVVASADSTAAGARP